MSLSAVTRALVANSPSCVEEQLPPNARAPQHLMVTMTVDLDAPPTTPSMRPPSSCSPHTSISPEAIDEKLKHYVGVFGSRWSLIRAHMTTAFSVAFPARYLENRWEALVLQEQQRSPDRAR